jgi:hypothetical protein
MIGHEGKKVVKEVVGGRQEEIQCVAPRNSALRVLV